MFSRCAEVVQRRGRKRSYKIRVLVKTVSGIFDYGEIASLFGVGVKPVSITQLMHIAKSLFGVSIVCSDFVLGVLWNADACKDADDYNYNQQFYECEA